VSRLIAMAVLMLPLLACSGGEGPKEPGRRGAKGQKAQTSEPEEPAPKPAGAKVEGKPRTIVLVVEDTVRADHMSLCGYSRPTTPFISSLLEKGAVHTCRAYTPGTWTLPSHASYFTGLHSTSHHVLNKGYPLPAEQETLAEHFSALGFQTLMVAANPTLNQATGLWAGFDEVRASKGLYSAWRGPAVAKQLQEGLAQLDPSKPLFLVVNIFDAHDPYSAIPKGIDWVPKRAKLDINPVVGGDDSPARRFVRGEMPPKEREAFLAHVVDTYDWGVYQADENLRRVITTLGGGGWLDEGFRVVVTSDHGEHLGEHDLIRHDGAPWEGVSRVPVLFFDDTLPNQPTLPEPMSATWVHGLLRDGALPATPGEVASAAVAYDQGTGLARKDSVALWTATDHKLLWIAGQEGVVNPVADPLESSQAPIGDDPAAPRLGELVQALSHSKEVAFGHGVDPQMMEALKAVGYLD
jgi:hypothetical protein